MKDQFANYVVQKVLETCDDQQRELILYRIKVHLNALKKYTYGKHIVARVEKLVAAGGNYSPSMSFLICILSHIFIFHHPSAHLEHTFIDEVLLHDKCIHEITCMETKPFCCL